MSQELIQQVANGPLLMEPGAARLFFQQLSKSSASATPDTSALSPEVKAMVTGFGSADHKPYAVTDGIAVIPIQGALLHKCQYSCSWVTGYPVIQRKLEAALADPEVRGILLDINSPGGTVAGCFDLVDWANAHPTRGKKPIWSLGNEMHYSAAQALASIADRHLITQTGGAGSVGVIMAHVDFSKYLDEVGLKVTLITAGDHKADGNPYEQLPAAVRDKWQAECEQIRQLFADRVATGTGMTLEAVLATEAQCYSGQEAVEVGLCSEVVNAHDALTLFSQHLSGAGRAAHYIQGDAMTDKTATPGQQPTEAAAASEPQTPEAQTQPETPSADAAAEERARIKGIMTHAEAEGRPALAAHLAYNTDMGVEAAADVLKASPTAAAPAGDAQPAAAPDPLSQAMAATEQPQVTPAAQTPEANEASEADAFIASWKKAKGE